MRITATLPADEGIITKLRGRRLVLVKPREVFKIEEWEQDLRFVREVELLERSGRVSSRYDLERAIGMEKGALATVRLGMRGVSKGHISRLFTLYRGDKDFILFGAARATDLTNPYISGVGRIDKFEPFIHRYSSVARWKVGPRPETHPEYYPSDPNNEQWAEPARKNIKRAGVVKRAPKVAE